MPELVLASNRLNSHVREETLGGRPFLVAPVVAIVAGVLNGELVPAAEIEASVHLWNGRPVPVGHPRANGEAISANSPSIEESAVVGRFYNASFEKDRLKGEIWIDIEKALAMGGDALTMMEQIRKGQGVEVSTAFWRILEEVPGTLMNQHYEGIAHDLRPDHLALLPHEIGACSWLDGCGVPRVNQDEGDMAGAERNGVLKRALRVLAQALGIDQQDADESPIEDLPAEAPVQNQSSGDGEQDQEDGMGKEELVAKLAANQRCPFDADELSAMGEGTLQKLEKALEGGCGSNQPAPVATNAEAAVDQPAAEEQPVAEEQRATGVESVVAKLVMPQELQELSAALRELGGVAGLKGALEAVQANANQVKVGLVGELTANERCAFTADELAAMSVAQLQKLAASLRPANYGGRGTPRANAENDDEQVPEPPAILLA